MWWTQDMDWGIGVVVWLLVVWAAVLLTAWSIFRIFGGPRHHAR